jgi:peptidyl-dipeptidase Dcp
MPSPDQKKLSINPAIAKWGGPLGLPDFAAFSDDDFDAAFAVALPAHLDEIDAIANNPEVPSFANTIVALERAGELLNRAASIFCNLSGANTNDTIQELERKLSPEMSRHSSAISMNASAWMRCIGIATIWGSIMRRPGFWS